MSSISVCLSVYVQRAALTTPPPFGRTLSCQRFAPRLSGVDSSPETSSGPLPRIVSQSPWEWVASAHPPGKHVPHPADKPQ